MDRRVSCLLVLLLLGSSLIWPSSRHATAQDDPPAAGVRQGDGDDPDAEIAPLNDLSVRDAGNILVSYTTIDVPIAELLADDHTIVLTFDDEIVARGPIAGEGTDVYVAIIGESAAAWGGIGWLHERGERTQISLFISDGWAAGGGSTPTEEPGPPEPPDDQTPTPDAEATSTPRTRRTPTPSTSAKRTYTSPTYDYTLAYDPAVWTRTSEISQPDETGPVDVLQLASVSQASYVVLVGQMGEDGFDAVELCDARLDGYSRDAAVSGLVVRESAAGDAEYATVLFDYTFTNDDGSWDWSTLIACYGTPDNRVLISLIVDTLRESYDAELPIRDDLISGLSVDGE